MTKSRFDPDFDLHGPGKRHGFLRLFHAVHRSAHGFIPCPAGVICGGAVPPPCWSPVTMATSGRVRCHPFTPDGRLAGTTLFYKALGAS